MDEEEMLDDRREEVGYWMTGEKMKETIEVG